MLLKFTYNISPFHPLAKYPGPLLWRATRLVNSYHHATGDLYIHIAAIHEKYGPTVRIAPDELSFTSPDAWPEIYNSRPQLMKSRYHFGHDESGKMPMSMIAAPDAEHSRVRRLAGPAFLNSSVAEVEPTMQHYAELLCSQLRAASEETPQQSQNMVDWFLWTLNDVIGQLALGQEFDCLQNRRLHEWPSYLLHILKLAAVINQFKRFGFKTQWLKPILPAKVIEKRDKFFETAQKAVDARLAQEKSSSSSSEPPNSQPLKQDIIGLLLRPTKSGELLTPKEILSNSVLIVGGGAETTATTLTAAMYHLCKTPRVMKKLQKEIRETLPLLNLNNNNNNNTTTSSTNNITLKSLPHLPYLSATIDETLRIFPTASFITPRQTPPEGHTINGQVIPGGTYVSMGQWFMGRSDRFFEDASEFRPERWLDDDDDDENSNTTTPCGKRIEDILKPFSMGPRNCVGKV